VPALGFTSREAVDTYAGYEGFSDSVKRAKTLVENAYEKRLHGNNVAGAIFALKNMGWRDRQDLDVTNREEYDPSKILEEAHRRADEKARAARERARNGSKDQFKSWKK
jgi:hypothetical protein